jgi:hypothetical protein
MRKPFLSPPWQTPRSREDALASPLTHVPVSGGYKPLGELKMPATGDPRRCDPPANAPHMSVHALTPPDPNAGQVTFYWDANNKAWVTFNPYARRMGFRPEYLSRAGWHYASRIA